MNGKLRNEIGENQVYHDEEGQNSQAFDVKEVSSPKARMLSCMLFSKD